MAARPGVVQAAHGAGTPHQSTVNCDIMGGLMQVEALAAAALGLTSQFIAYQYAIYDETHKTPVIGYWPSGFGYFTHTRNPSTVSVMGGITVTSPNRAQRCHAPRPPPAAYSVWTKHWFWTCTTWAEGPWVRTASDHNFNSGETPYCLL